MNGLASRDRPISARWLLVVPLALWAIGPLLLLLALSFGREWFWPRLLPASYDLEAWRIFLEPGSAARTVRAAVNSVALGLATGAIASMAALPIGRALARLTGWQRAVGAAAAFLPVAAPPITIAIGLQYAFLRVAVAGSHFGVLMAHLIPALGYASLFFLGTFLVYDERLEMEARSLGAAPVQVFWRVSLPRLRRPLLEAALLGFLVSWSQVPLTLLVGQGLVPTLAVEVLSFVSAGQDRLAAAGAILLIVPALAAVAVATLAARRTDAVAM